MTINNYRIAHLNKDVKKINNDQFFQLNVALKLYHCSFMWFRIFIVATIIINLLSIYLGFTPCKVKQPLQGMELQEKETQKD